MFSDTFTPDMIDEGYDASHMLPVRIPHSCKETPFHYFDESEYQMVSGYRKIMFVPKGWERKLIFLTFEGIAHLSEVYVNGILVGTHSCGYTAFTLDVSDKLQYGDNNLLTVRVDSREELNVPPFGFVIDYMTYGGILCLCHLSVVT